MIGIRIADSHISLPKGTGVPFERSNALMQFKAIDPSYTLPLNIPNTPRVRKIFGNGHDPGAKLDRSQKFTDSALTVDGNDYWKGVVEISSVGEKIIVIAFRFGSGYLASQGKDKMLRDLFPDEKIAMTIETDDKLTVTFADQGIDADHNAFFFEIYGVTYSRMSATDSVATIVNNLEADIAAAISGWSVHDNGGLPVGNRTMIFVTGGGVLSPLIYSQRREDNGEGGGIENWPKVDGDDLGSFVQSNDVTITGSDLDTKFVLPMMHIPNLYNGENEGYSGFVNIMREGTMIFGKLKDQTSFETTLIPCILHRWLIPAIFEKLGITVSGEFFDDVELMSGHEFVPRPIDKEVQFANLLAPFLVEVPISDLLPDISVRDFFKAHRIQYGLHFDFDLKANHLNINFAKGLISTTEKNSLDGKVVDQGDVFPHEYDGMRIGYTLNDSDLTLKEYAIAREDIQEDFPDVATIAERDGLVASIAKNIVFVTSKNSWYIKAGIGVDNWDLHAYNIDDYRDGNEVLELVSPYSPIIELDLEESGRFVRCPSVDVVGFVPAFGLNTLDRSPRFGIYRGLQEDSEGDNYHMSSLHSYRYDETPLVDANYTFSWAKVSGHLQESFYPKFKAWQERTNNSPLAIILTKTELNNLNLSEKQTFQSIDYLVESVSGALTDSDNVLVDLKVKRV